MTDEPPECQYDGCTRPATHFRFGKRLCTNDFNEEYRRRMQRRRGPHP